MLALISKIKVAIVARHPWLRNYPSVFRWIYEKLLWPMRYMPGSSVNWGPPRGLYRDAAEYNSRSTEKPIKEMVLREAMNDNYKMPWSNSAIVLSYFKDRINAGTIEKKAWILNHARYIYGEEGTVITSDDKIFLPASPVLHYRTYKNHQSLFHINLPKMMIFKKVILIDTRKVEENNYCHWMRDHITRFFWLKKLDIDFSDYTLIASNGSAGYCSFTRKILMDSGFNFKEWLFVSDVRHFYAEEMIIPPYIVDDLFDGISDIDELRFLKSLFLDTTKTFTDGYDKIYLSRRKASRRFSPVQEELVSRLAGYGVKEIFLEDLTINEQAAIIYNATLIIGLHGAGFTNLIFCKPGTTVIEIFGADQIVSCFWTIAEKLNLKYYAYCDDEFIGSNPHPFRHLAPTYMNIDNFFTCFKESKLLLEKI